MNRTIIVRRNYLHFVKKYQRQANRDMSCWIASSWLFCSLNVWLVFCVGMRRGTPTSPHTFHHASAWRKETMWSLASAGKTCFYLFWWSAFILWYLDGVVSENELALFIMYCNPAYCDMKYLCGPLPLSWSVSCTILISGHYQRLWGSMCSKSFRQVQRVEQWRKLSRLLKMMMSNPSEGLKSLCYTILMLSSLFLFISTVY